tara:strand:+ start:18775 stop:19128 length:354 start_codon:yes stop_codon:yes gene_type:complete
MNSQIPKPISPEELNLLMKDEFKRPLVIDVREDYELEIAPFSYQVLHLPLSQISIWGNNCSEKFPLDKQLVIICHSGIRSMNFGIWLLQQGFDNQIWNLDGGIDLWSLKVDSSVPRY